jgi:acetoin utilization deacetylase AcuC-like enzyme
VLLVSAGYDAHERDPLGGMRVSTAGYAAIVARLRDAAARACGGRIALVTEGGYDLPALADCLNASIAILEGKEAPASPQSDEQLDNRRGRAAVEAVRGAQEEYWPDL